MKILITGGAGFVGKNLIRVLQQENFNLRDVTVIDKDQTDFPILKNFGVNLVCADLSEKGSWGQFFQGQDMVVSLHAQISAPDYEPFKKNNIDATRQVIEASQAHGVRKIIHFSSAAVLSVRQDFYASTKKEADEIIKKSSLNYVIIVPSLMYGLFDHKNIGWLIDFFRKIPVFPMPGSGKYPRQPIFVDDICQLVVKLIRDFPRDNKVYNINGQKTLYFREMIKTVLKEMGGWRKIVYLPIPIFIFLIKVYDLLFGSPFTPDQIKSLTSGDVFPDYPWWDEFKIPTTSFADGVRKMLNKD